MEARCKLDNAIAALDREDGPAYALAIREFGTVRRTAQEWMGEMQ